MNKIESFKSFSQLQSQLREEAAQKELAAKREASVEEYNELLSKYNVAKITELSEEDRATFMQELGEGNAFTGALKKAKEDGEDEFKVGDETYKVEEDESEDEDDESEEDESEDEDDESEDEDDESEEDEEDEDEEDLEEGRAFVSAAKKAKEEGKEEFEYNGKTFPVLIKEGVEITEILEANKRQVAAVAKSYNTYAGKFPVFNQMNDVTFLWTIREILKSALIDANFHTEAAMIGKYITPAKFENIEINPAELGGKIFIKVPKKVITDMIDLISSNVTGAAKYDGYAIIEGTAEYLSGIRVGKRASEGIRAALAALQA